MMSIYDKLSVVSDSAHVGAKQAKSLHPFLEHGGCCGGAAPHDLNLNRAYNAD